MYQRHSQDKLSQDTRPIWCFSHRIKPGGAHIHELGTARMGTRREDSVTDTFSRLWDSPNVSVVDGATFPTNPDKNPTLTIAALCLRACDKILA